MQKGYDKISMDRWREAQTAERTFHTMNFIEGQAHYKSVYEKYFKLLKLGFDLGGLSVTEIGCADFPALVLCKNYDPSFIIEPMPSSILRAQIDDDPHILLFNEPLEKIKINFRTDEVWLFNVMQHIIDPDTFVNQCKNIGGRIRFFEPINYPTAVHHPHAFTLSDFKGWFGNCTQFYKGGSVADFHQADCAYGTYIPE